MEKFIWGGKSERKKIKTKYTIVAGNPAISSVQQF